MRLIGSIDSEQKAQTISVLLAQNGIESQCEVIENKDWGHDDYGTKKCHIWIIDEDQLDKAQELFDTFVQNPNQQLEVGKLASDGQHSRAASNFTISTPQSSLPKRERFPFGKITLYLLCSCVLLFIWSGITSPSVPATIPSAETTHLPMMALFNSPVKKHLMYDYPKAFVIIDKVVTLYGLDKVLDPAQLPPEGEYLMKEYEKTPYWQGIYEMVVDYFRDKPHPWNFSAPMFEKIHQGEVWRIFTPCLLHHDILHIFFNMFWLVLLGNQLEHRLARGRYLLLVIVSAIVSNTAQYMMTGANFIGFSGVLCAMFGFIWMRQRHAPWEGYQLDRMTIGFITLFILGMFAVQMLSFYLQIQTGEVLAVGIANTAHLSGALTGILLGRWNFFSWGK